MYTDYGRVKCAARDVMIKHRRIGFEFHFDAKDEQFIKKAQRMRPREDIFEPGDDESEPPSKKSRKDDDGSKAVPKGKNDKKCKKDCEIYIHSKSQDSHR